MVNYNSSQFETTQSGTPSCTFSIELKRQEGFMSKHRQKTKKEEKKVRTKKRWSEADHLHTLYDHHKAMGNTEEAREILAKLIKMEEEHVMN